MTGNKILRKIGDEFIYGGHLLSLGASGIILSTTIILNQKFNFVLLLLGYLISQLVYSFDHFKDFKKDIIGNPSRVKHLAQQKKYFFIIFFVYFSLFIFSLLYLGNKQASALSIFILLGGFLSPYLAKPITRKIVGFKNFYVAFFWSLLVILTALYYGFSLTNNIAFMFFLFIFLRWVVNSSFFDIKDIESDKDSSIKTFPVILGKNATINFLHIVNVLSLAPIIIGVLLNLLPIFSLGLLVFYFYSFYYLEKIKTKKADIGFLSYVLADGEYLLWPLAVLIVKINLC